MTKPVIMLCVLLLAGCTPQFFGQRSISRMSQEILLTPGQPRHSRFGVQLISVGADGCTTAIFPALPGIYQAMPGEKFHRDGEVEREAFFLVSSSPDRGEARLRVSYCEYK